MTRIVFDNKGKPHWITVPASGAWLHNVKQYADIAHGEALERVPFTQEDLDWFRKPVSFFHE